MKYNTKNLRKTFIVMIITGLFSSLNAKTIVVNNQIPNAKDTNSGTFTQPFKSIQAGANQAQAGDTILVKAGICRLVHLNTTLAMYIIRARLLIFSSPTVSGV